MPTRRAHQRADARPERAAARPRAALQGQAAQRDARAALAFHPPCTLQHGQQLRGGVETHWRALGFDVQRGAERAHLCCGSAGTYSVLQPELAYQLRDRKLGHLDAAAAAGIVSANIGCIPHLQTGTATPVRHWVEVLDAALPSQLRRSARRRTRQASKLPPAMKSALVIGSGTAVAPWKLTCVMSTDKVAWAKPLNSELPPA